MGTINEKLDYLETTKTKIKEAIVAKGVAVDDATTFRQYADKITSIPQEGGGGTTQKVPIAVKTTFDNSPSTGAYDFAETMNMANFDMGKTKNLTIKNFTVTGLTNDAVNGMEKLNLSDSKFNANDISGNKASVYFLDVNTSNIDENTNLTNNRCIGFSSIHPNASGTYNDFVFDFDKFNVEEVSKEFYFNLYDDSFNLLLYNDNTKRAYSFNFPNSKLTIQKLSNKYADLKVLDFDQNVISELEFNYTYFADEKLKFRITYNDGSKIPKLKKITNLNPDNLVYISTDSSLLRCPFDTFSIPVDINELVSSKKIPYFSNCKNLTTVDLFYEPTEDEYNNLVIQGELVTINPLSDCPKLTTIKFPKVKAEIDTTALSFNLFGYSNSFEEKVTVYIDATWQDYIVKQFAETGVPESQYEIITY